jgi:tetratricopeptide (TPR) repeat protein
VYGEMRDHDKAVEQFLLVPPDSEFFGDARVHVGYIRQRQGRLDDAIAAIKQAIDAKPENADLIGLLATMYREKGDLAQAVELVRTLVARNPDNDKYRFTLGALYDEMKDKQASMAEMRRAIELNPANAAALNYLGYTYAEQGTNLDEAEELIRRALAIDPNDGFYVDSLAWVFYQRGDYSKAIEHLERAIELAGEDPTITEHLADAYQKVGKSTEALNLYQEALQRSKDNKQLDRLKDKIQRLGGTPVRREVNEGKDS